MRVAVTIRYGDSGSLRFLPEMPYGLARFEALRLLRLSPRSARGQRSHGLAAVGALDAVDRLSWR
jgi:hypothetical protein